MTGRKTHDDDFVECFFPFLSSKFPQWDCIQQTDFSVLKSNKKKQFHLLNTCIARTFVFSPLTFAKIDNWFELYKSQPLLQGAFLCGTIHTVQQPSS